MRWSYLAPRLVLVVVVWTFFAFAFDPLVRWSLVRAGQAVARARVDIGDVETRFFPPSLEAGQVRVANRDRPGTNLFEFDTIRVRLAGTPLLYRAFVVEEGTLTGLRWGTARDDLGLLDDTPGVGDWVGRSLAPLRARAGQLARYWLDDALDRARQQFDPRQLETVRLSDELEREWKDRFDSLQDRIKSLERRADVIREQVRRSDGNVLERLDAWQQAAAEVNQLLRDAARIREELAQLSGTAQRDYQRLDDARRRDLDSARRKVESLTSPDGQAVSEALFGRELIARLEQAVEWVAWTRDRLAAATADVRPDRGRGIDVTFPRTAQFPGVLVRELTIAGETEFAGDRLSFSGVVKGLTSDPPLYGQPAVLRLTASGRTRLEIEAIADHTRPQPAYEITSVYTIPEPAELELGGDENLSIRLAAASTRWRARVRVAGDELSGTVELSQHGVSATLAEAGDGNEHDLARVLSPVLDAIDTVDAKVDLSGRVDQPVLSLRSNLGPQLAAGLNDALAGELNRRRDELAARIDAESRARLSGFATLVNGGFRDSSSRLDLSETAARRLVEQVSAKPPDVRNLLRRE
ncbi:MAG TPA: TIGR03545 family protein [Planctomycetaceae bacterium]|nr:TIGR03545 family protein [Planctomycetaceae bacterium]